MAKKPTDLDDVLNVIADFAGMVDKRFGNLEGRFDSLEGRFDNLEDRFDHLEGRFDKLEIEVFKRGRDLDDVKADVKAVKDKVNHIYSGLDSQAKQIDDIRLDNKVRDHQHERLERWVLELADKINVKLKYE